MNLFTKIGVRVLGGVGIGAIASLFFLIIAYVQKIQALNTELLLINVLASYSIGIILALSSLIFDVERWSLLKQTIAHLFIVILTFFPITIWVGWMDKNLFSILMNMIVFIAMYGFIWMGIYIYWKKKIENLNKSLR